MGTSLPNRDIQMNTQQQQDPYMQPNYIPESEMNDYIENDDTLYSMMNAGDAAGHEQDRLDQLYEELQIPLMVMVLYFLSTREANRRNEWIKQLHNNKMF